jgi:UTP-glucose-1-phosphate uridylyltransferase
VALETILPKAVILAAGRGECLRPLTDGLPKPMLPIGERPLLDHLLALPAGQAGLDGASTARKRRLGGVYAAG